MKESEAIKSDVQEIKRKTLAQMFDESCTVKVDQVLVTGAFQIPLANTQSTLSTGRTSGLELVYHCIAHVIVGRHKGKYFMVPATGFIVAHEG